ncbi:hypothetical protein AUC44_15010 [Deinococcus actinosclerus]|uniref:Transposase IS200-like domain-containing protein n=1 Tax=Deinococcus actinosclerus TaxID=1768108 RepID=A0ABM5X8M5_9DEIO|nr:hypothetical protein AUC44_15010 [Deinococcus actinosclerus]
MHSGLSLNHLHVLWSAQGLLQRPSPTITAELEPFVAGFILVPDILLSTAAHVSIDDQHP